MKLKPIKAWAVASNHWGIFPGYLFPTKKVAQGYMEDHLQNATDRARVVRVLVMPI